MTSSSRGRLCLLWVALVSLFAIGCSNALDSGEDVGSVSQAACVGSALTPTPAGPVNAGTSVTLTATAATCGAGETAEYRYVFRREGTATYTQIQDWSTSTTAVWNTTGLAAGQYDVILYTRAQGGTVAQYTYHRNYFINNVCTSVNGTVTPSSPQVPGTTVNINATSVCNGGATPEYRYQYRLTTGGAWTDIANWSASATAAWNTTGVPTGQYYILVLARATGNSSAWEATKYINYTIGGGCSGLTLNAAPASPQLPGTIVNLTASATCAGGTPQYRFFYQKPGNQTWFLIQDWNGTTAVWNTTGLGIGVHTLRVDVRANGTGAEGVTYLQYTLANLGYKQIAVGMNFTSCAAVNDGTARCWGQNSDGQLGNGSTGDSSSPVTVTGISGVSTVAPGGFHSCALLASGSVSCWGLNSDGQLGNGTQTGSTIPVTVSGVSNAIAVSSGTYHSCAVISGGTVMCWGDNEFGQIGNGTFTGNVLTPITVAGISGATEVSVGGWHTCVRAGGSVQCWGLNDHGQIGAGTTNQIEVTPLTVSSLSGATTLGAGDSHTCAIQSGVPRCWGLNMFGQLGNGTTTDTNVPAVVTGLTAMTTISGGYAHTCSRHYPDGTLRCWGDNGFGELGNGTTTSSTTPVTVTGVSTATSVVAAGGVYSCALLQSGGARCWGFNSNGQLGNGTTTDSSTAVVVLGP